MEYMVTLLSVCMVMDCMASLIIIVFLPDQYAVKNYLVCFETRGMPCYLRMHGSLLAGDPGMHDYLIICLQTH